MKTVTVVCTGNICRSPMAEGLLRERLARAGFGGKVRVISRGVASLDGEPASGTGVQLLLERGINIKAHRAATLTESDLKRSDLVLVMEESHRRVIRSFAPHSLPRVLLWTELDNGSGDVADPYLRGVDAYKSTLDLLETHLNAGWETLLDRLNLAPVAR